MRKFILTFVFLFSVFFVFAQTTIYENNFDSYENGAKIAQTAGEPWTTWTGALNDTLDGTISDSVSVSPNNSLHIVRNNDLVYKLNSKTAGSFRIDFKIFVEADKIAYFNLLQDFSGNSSKWGVDALFLTGPANDNGDNGYFSIDGSRVYFTYEPATWIDMSFFVDLENDAATILMNDEVVKTWQWSLGATGNNNLLKLDAIDFFGHAAEDPVTHQQRVSSYYIDDFRVDSLPEVPAISNLTAVKNTEQTGIDLAWDAPAETPKFYTLIKNGVNINGITTNSFADTNLYPNNYTYKILAFYDSLGFSTPSDATNPIKIGEFVDKELVLVEVAIGTSCQFCPGAAMAVEDLYDSSKNIAAIKYQVNSETDPYYNGVGLQRAERYGIEKFPTAIFDGNFAVKGGSPTQSVYPTYILGYDNKIALPGLYNLSAQIEPKCNNNYTATVNVEQISDYFGNNVKLYLAVTESGLQYNWGIQTEVNQRCIGMYPSETGEVLDFSESNTVEKQFDFNFEIFEGLTNENYKLVVFVQADESNMVAQTIAVDIPKQPDNITKITESNIVIYPNPASDFIKIKTQQGGDLKISDITGRVVKKQKINADEEIIDIQNLNMGLYIINIYNGTEIYTEKIIIK